MKENKLDKQGLLNKLNEGNSKDSILRGAHRDSLLDEQILSAGERLSSH